MDKKKGSRRKSIRYFRWSVKAAFLLIFVLPIVNPVGAPANPVYSFFYGGLNQPFLKLPFGQSVCAVWILPYVNMGPGAWLICPVGGLLSLLTGQMPVLIPLTIIALLVFLMPIFVLGNVFCSWLCPLGTMIAAFDKGVERFMPKVNMKREERSERNKEKKKTAHSFVCPTCPFGKLLGNKHATVANGVLVSSLVGSAVFGLPVFCTICPIGILTTGMFHLKALTSVTTIIRPIIIELWAIPAVPILASLREKRYWCRKICPVGAILNIAGSFNPIIKPTVKADRCIACMRCEKVCPKGINLIDKGSLAKCNKCLECYIQCERDAIDIKLFGTPDAVSTIRRFKAKLKRQPKNPAN